MTSPLSALLVLLGVSSVLVACLTEDGTILRERLGRRAVNERTILALPENGTYVSPRPDLAPPVVRGCEPGTRKACSRRITAALGRQLWSECRQGTNGVWAYSAEDCATPLVVAFDGAAVIFTQPDGVFPIGPWERTEWVSPSTPWLALDLDGSGCIEGEPELFGPPTDGSGTNGFDKLALLDETHDGRIDAADRAFSSLLLWTDRNQDRRCTASEVTTIAAAGILAIDLGYATPVPAGTGSREGERAAMTFRSHEGRVGQGRVVDVYLAPLR